MSACSDDSLIISDFRSILQIRVIIRSARIWYSWMTSCLWFKDARKNCWEVDSWILHIILHIKYSQFNWNSLHWSRYYFQSIRVLLSIILARFCFIPSSFNFEVSILLFTANFSFKITRTEDAFISNPLQTNTSLQNSIILVASPNNFTSSFHCQ